MYLIIDMHQGSGNVRRPPTQLRKFEMRFSDPGALTVPILGWFTTPNIKRRANTPIMHGLHYGDHQVSQLSRSQKGSIAAPIDTASM
jgi:hypothetical protein